ncbi:PAS domain S-box protein [Nodosilinea sp. E11]|uniref:PAS domain S-box protein n=1 Tax=Nodosilinea sp. E11 TaxID=3037479 RepID=UPI002934F312|nr:PAS domain S-box protein [Nodosilinea sp. E11]WOD37034.1 PAS domain S-box protein [Nodosilinea sp. E11]
MSDRLNNYLRTPQQVVAANHFEVEQGTLNLNDLEQLRRQLWQQMILNPSVPSTMYWSEQGRGLGYGRLSSEEGQDLIQQLTGKTFPLGEIYLQVVEPNYRQFYQVDSQGKPQILIYQLKNDFRDLPWYRQSIAIGKQHWTPVFTSRVIPGLQILAVAPVQNAAGKTQGLFTSNYFLADFSRFLNTLQVSPTGQMFIMERSGDLVATSILSEEWAMKHVNGQPDYLPAVDSQDHPTRDIADQILQQFGNLQTIRDAQQLSLVVDGARQFVQVTPYKDNYGLDWLLVTVISESDFMAEIQAQKARTILLCWGTLLATSALGVLVARRITGPLHRLNIAASNIAQNNFAHSVPIGGLGEVKQLSQSFQQMAEELQLSFQLKTDYEQELKQQVAERTTELVQARDLREVIFNESTDGIFLVELLPTTRILDCNERAVELFEAESKAELIGIQGSTLQKQPYTEAELAEIAAELEQKGFWSREIEYVTKKGKSFWGNLAAKPIFVAGQGMQLVRLTDISDRKQIEAQLRRTEQWLQQYSRQSPTTIYTVVLEPDGRVWFEYISAAVEGMHEVSREQVLADAQILLSQIHPDDRAGYLEATAHSAETLDMFCHEWRIVTPSGQIKWQQGNSQPEQRPSGAIAWHGVVQDITARKQVEELLRESEERFRQAFDNAAIGIALVAIGGRFLKVNRSLCEMLGYSEAEMLERSFQDITPPADLDSDLELAQQMLSGERRTCQLEKRYVHKQGTTVWALLCVSLVKDSAGQPLYFVSQIQDISDRHKLDVMKEEFISVVSHELRTPLTSIRGSLGLLETGVLNDEPETAKRMLQVALNSTDRLVRLVNDILDLERLESGKVPLVLDICDVCDLMGQAVELVQAIADQATVTLVWEPLSASVQAAPDAIVQLLTNLLSNAIKFSPPGSTVSLKAAVIDQSLAHKIDQECPSRGFQHSRFSSAPPTMPLSQNAVIVPCSIVFSVADQGRGIPPEKLETIFERFQQVDSSDSRQKGGTGLGLAICKSIVQQHQGAIWAESILGQGSTFYFTLPTAA